MVGDAEILMMVIMMVVMMMMLMLMMMMKLRIMIAMTVRIMMIKITMILLLTSFISFIGIEHVLERLIPSMIIKHDGLIAGIEYDYAFSLFYLSLYQSASVFVRIILCSTIIFIISTTTIPIINIIPVSTFIFLCNPSFQ